jgi:DNA-directed RNA polymerase subunit L
MDLKIIENKKDRLKIEVRGESHSLLNILRENAWASGAKDASYFIEHPYLSEPKIIVKSNNPKRTLTSATQLVIDQASDFEKEIKRATRK